MIRLFLLEKINSLMLYLFIMFLPFIVFYWMVPFIFHFTIGNDYIKFPIRQQMELLFSLKTGSFPLYVPGFASGHSSTALTLGQIFHPLSWIVSIMPGYWDGKVIDWNNFFKLLSLGFTQLILHFFLKRFGISVVLSFMFSFVTVYTLRMLNLFQYGAPLEAYTGYLILCSLIGLYCINSKGFFLPLAIIFTTYSVICSGHPEEMYYGLLAAGLFTLIAPFYISTMLSDVKIDFKSAFRFWLKTVLFLFLGIILSSTYIVPFYLEFLRFNVHRVGQNYKWANFVTDTFIGTLNNFFLPLRSQTFSAFGGSSLIIMAVTLPVVRLFRIRFPRPIWTLWFILFVIFMHMLGNMTPVHRLFWEYLPFASSIRLPGRISIIMPFFMMLILGWIAKSKASTIFIGESSVNLRPVTILASVTVLLILIYYLFCVIGYYVFHFSSFLKWFNPHFKDNLRYLNISYEEVEITLIILGVLSLLSLIFYVEGKKLARWFGMAVLIIAVILQLGIAFKYRSMNWITSKERIDIPTFNEMKSQKGKELTYLYYPGAGLQSSIVTKQLDHSFIEPFLGKIFTEVIPVNSQEEAYEKMWRMRLPQQVFIEGYDVKRAGQITDGAKDMRKGEVSLVYSSFNRLEFKVYSEKPAIFGLSYPYTDNWRAWVNGEKVKVYRANGTAHAVEIPEGESIVEFRYWSGAFFWGMIISCMTFTLIGVFVGLKGFRGLRRAIIVIVVIVIGAGTFMLWYKSLYNGENLETEYTWTYTPPSSSPNLAYGKKNWTNISTIHLNETYRELELYRGKIVDGDKSPGNGFITCYYDSSAWFVDLSRDKKIKKILFYYSNKVPPFLLLKNCSVFEDERGGGKGRKIYDILASNDRERWKIIGSVEVENNGSGVREVIFQDIQTARFIQIKLQGRGQLSFDEIEIY